MVEYKNSFFDERSDDSPPLVQAERAIPDLHTLQPIGVAVVTIDGPEDPLCQASVVSYDSNDAEGTLSRESSGMAAGADENEVSWSAGIAGGVVGTLVGGPILGIVAGGAAAYYSQKEGAAGDISRAVGEIGRTTGKKAKELNEKHQLVDKSKEAAEEAWKKVQELNERHKFAGKGKEAASEAWDKFKKFDREHGVLKKLSKLAMFCLNQIVKFVEYVAQKAQKLEPCEPQMQRASQTANMSKLEHTATAY